MRKQYHLPFNINAVWKNIKLQGTYTPLLNILQEILTMKVVANWVIKMIVLVVQWRIQGGGHRASPPPLGLFFFSFLPSMGVRFLINSYPPPYPEKSCIRPCCGNLKLLCGKTQLFWIRLGQAFLGQCALSSHTLPNVRSPCPKFGHPAQSSVTLPKVRTINCQVKVLNFAREQQFCNK